MLFEYKYRSHFRMSGVQFRKESEEDRWLMQTIWALEAERDTLKKQAASNS